MKTTVHIPDALFQEAQELARNRRTTLKALVQEGLRIVVSEGARQKGFQLRDASVGGTGISAELSEAGWDHLRDSIYEGHGA